ncbi:carbohydrate ABC transporter permease [Halanaerobium kushneri]|uniref:Carbohydrate ABC transporter membrane protein 2, CUT1 family n=1 Tax=Halanaerobium kushneri TaxID=56779 RepID=A0A1N6WNH5_9FIRM|nr:carbohydrate ABC transporter permease [Halanaerobium kushneri]SIQ91581.1 carbohydrate ABC transporter membrane protein 2, CUT1 family [Halanaerobium kushneri]
MKAKLKELKKSNIPLMIISTLLFLFYIFPFFLVLINSFKAKMEILSNPIALPKSINFDNFINAFNTMGYPSAITNSFIITTASLFLIIVFSSMLAYFLVRWDWKINKIIFMILVASMIIPFQALMIPFVNIYGSFNMLNSRLLLAVYYLGFGVSLATFMYHGFIKNIPLELEEAAKIDGATKLQVFWKIIFPILKPVTATIAILDVLWIWNDFLLPSLVLISKSMRTIPLSTFYFFGQYTSNYGQAMAALILAIIPVIIFYISMQDKIISGVIEGAGK